MLFGLFSKNKSFPIHKQLDNMDCGPACLKMILEFYGKKVKLANLRELASITQNGVSFPGLADAAESYGLRSLPVKISLEQLINEAPLPCIAHWEENHFVVVTEVSNKTITIIDPSIGSIILEKNVFLKDWIGKKANNDDKGFLLLLEPTIDFFESDEIEDKKSYLSILKSYLTPYFPQLKQLLLGLVFTALLQLSFPLLTQAVVDYGINLGDVGFIYLVLLAQLVLFASTLSFELIRGWILLYLAGKLNISLISDFLVRLLAMPITYFSDKHIGDIVNRINDNRKIQYFLSSSTLNTAFGLLTVFVFSFVLLYYSWLIFLIFVIGSAIYCIWTLRFLKQKEILNHEEFKQQATNQNNLYQLINGVEDIKLNGSEKKRRWEWEGIQAKLFHLSTKNLRLSQKQQFGANGINELKNIIITFVSATEVINGSITLGMMISIQYILGQLNVPLNNLVTFLLQAQEAKLSLDRLYEIQNTKKEETGIVNFDLSTNDNIVLSDLSFRYGPKESRPVINNINLEFQAGKTTAIVGVSGSGKTTLIKLLLKFYTKYQGNIRIGNTPLNEIDTAKWRSFCGVVMQDGKIFNDTFYSNITESDNGLTGDVVRYNKAVEVANLGEFLSKLPKKEKTIIGEFGSGISGGEKQRILIARAIYKNPKILIFDEATSALDSNNEGAIMTKLNEFIKNRTTIIIAHRLSTVKKAHNIIVLEDGKIIEQGNHEELIKRKGRYLELVKNQLELGS